MRLNRKFWGFLGIAACVAICGPLVAQNPNTLRSLSLLINREALIEFFGEMHSSPVRGVGLFVLAHIIANAIGVPGTLLVVVGGAVYGLWWGTVWSVIGATLGAIAAFLLARHLLYDWFKQRFHKRPFVQKLNAAICQNSLSCMLIVRFSPVSPFNVVNFALGLTPVSVKYYAAGTLIGIIPGTLAYTWLGVTGAEALSTGRLLPLILCLCVLMLLSTLPLVIQRYQASR